MGFPQETMRKILMQHAHLFAMSATATHIRLHIPHAEGTVAARMDGQIPLEEKKRRLNALNAVLAETLPAGNEKYIGL